ncbi:Methyl-accepting chemotaxis protein I (serine chemoreceptor protein) [hydrothermal vent metagenome]|uniref:Methyl-accepting chemotaxis protein I (Serine chemoreceptor protein) n=1 Tax=hydrothermal vent metagenome TaxID=652676 RepID=A0A3B1BQ12_9ZZZZ
MIKRLNDLKIGYKLLLMLSLPLVGLLFFSVSEISDKWQDLGNAQAVQETVELSEQLDAVASNFAMERGLTAGFLGSGGKRFGSQLREQRAKTNAAIKALQVWLDGGVEHLDLGNIQADFDKLINMFGQRDAIRSAVDRLDRHSNAFAYYSGLNGQALKLVQKLGLQIDHATISRHARAYADLLWMKEYAGKERGTLSAVFASGQVDKTKVNTIIGHISGQSVFHDDFLLAADKSLKKFYLSQLSGEASDKVKAMRKAFLSGTSAEGGFSSVNANDWFKQSTARIKLIKGVASKAAIDLMDEADKLETKAGMTLGFYGIFTLIFVVISTFLALLIGRRLSDGIADIVATLRKVEKEGDFGARAAVTGRDELGAMAGTLNRHMQALQQAIGGVGQVMTAAASGDFGKRVETELKGDLDRLKNGVNTSMNAVQTALSEVNGVMSAVAKGDFAQRVEGDFQGEFASFRDNVNAAVDSLERMTKALSAVMKAIVAGDFKHRMAEDIEGDIRKDVDCAMESMETVIGEISQVMTAMADGDLNQQLAGDYPGQLTLLKDSINSSLANQRRVVTEVRQAVQQISTGASEIAKGNMDLSQRTEEQASSLEETASSMEEMTSTVKQNADNARQANQLAVAGREQAEQGGGVVSKAVSAMLEINTSSKKIAAIISVIDEIAFQTNLLALNAAVEAARAGEQGRGFAVVAGEVRNLAQRSAGAAKEIKELIEDSVSKVEEGSDLVDQSGNALEEIVTAVKKVSDIIAEIAAASEEQSSGIEQVNSAIAQMDEVTQQNAALVEEAAAASQSLDEQGQRLTSLIGFFRTENEEGVEAGSRPQTTGKHSVDRPSHAPLKKNAETVSVAKSDSVVPVKHAGSDDNEWETF